MKRMIPLLFALSIVFIIVPDAEASHCLRCRFAQPSTECVVAVFGGWTDCFINQEGLCENGGTLCTHGFAETPLAAQFTVASVERLDAVAADAKAEVTRLASADEKPQPATER